jgi:phosphonate transport system substrate-binding protein
MVLSRRAFLRALAYATSATTLVACGANPTPAAPANSAVTINKKLNFGVGPLLPSPEDTKKAYDPFFKYLAQRLGAPSYDLVATTDWAGISVAMSSGQLDLAWMGPWGYVLANNATDCYAIATVKYDDKPIYHAIIIAQPEITVAKFPDDTKGLSISFADLGSTSGWLIPTYYAQAVWKIDPKTFWKYSEGATHAANEIAVQAKQVQLATDFDRNRNAMIATNKIKETDTKVVWQSDPLPNDALAVPKGTPKELAERIQAIVTALTPEQAKDILPPRYTGFVAATHASYATIEKAGIVVGKIKAKP